MLWVRGTLKLGPFGLGCPGREGDKWILISRRVQTALGKKMWLEAFFLLCNYIIFKVNIFIMTLCWDSPSLAIAFKRVLCGGIFSPHVTDLGQVLTLPHASLRAFGLLVPQFFFSVLAIILCTAFSFENPASMLAPALYYLGIY